VVAAAVLVVGLVAVGVNDGEVTIGIDMAGPGGYIELVVNCGIDV